MYTTENMRINLFTIYPFRHLIIYNLQFNILPLTTRYSLLAPNFNNFLTSVTSYKKQ